MNILKDFRLQTQATKTTRNPCHTAVTQIVEMLR